MYSGCPLGTSRYPKYFIFIFIFTFISIFLSFQPLKNPMRWLLSSLSLHFSSRETEVELRFEPKQSDSGFLSSLQLSLSAAAVFTHFAKCWRNMDERHGAPGS